MPDQRANSRSRVPDGYAIGVTATGDSSRLADRERGAEALRDPRAWPATGNEDRVAIGFRQWQDAASRLPDVEGRAFADALPGSEAGGAMLRCLFGASPFLTACAVRDLPFVRRLWESGPDHCVEVEIASIRRLPVDLDQHLLRRHLRITRRRVALAVALADIAGCWQLSRVTEILTTLAESATSAVLRPLIAKLAKRGLVSSPDPADPETGCGLIALGLGKLGGRELNYSSDIDLILLYDPDRMPATGRWELPGRLMQLAHQFIAILSEPTADGIAFRVDLRLRPDPVSMPLVVSTKSALSYYDKRGQTWERAALIKARPIAGDVAAGNEFLRNLRPFIWRRHLDFATVQGLHEIKRRIDEQHRGGRAGELGQDLKLGRGGIREIEFFAQAHQLAWGGADPQFRTIPTCPTLRGLAKAGRLPGEAAESLISAYEYLRRAEHRIQMVADKQTHALPTDPAEFETLSHFLGYADGAEFRRTLVGHLDKVERQYESYFELPFEMTEAAASSRLADATSEEAKQRLARLGFQDPGAAFKILEDWRAGEPTAPADQAAHELLQLLAPSISIAACGTPDPDLALRRFDGMIRRTQDRQRAFSLLQANLHVMEIVTDVMVSFPAVASMLTSRPELLDELLDPATDAALPSEDTLRSHLAASLARAGDARDAGRRLRTWIATVRFRIAVRVLFRSLDPLEGASRLLAVARQAVQQALRIARDSIETDSEADVAVLLVDAVPRLGSAQRWSLALCHADAMGSTTHQLAARLQDAVLALLDEEVDLDGTSHFAALRPPLPLDALDRRTAAALPHVVDGSITLAECAEQRIVDVIRSAGPSGQSRGDHDLESELRQVCVAAARHGAADVLPRSIPQAVAVGQRSGLISDEDGDSILAAWRRATRLTTLSRLLGVHPFRKDLGPRPQALAISACGCASFDELAARVADAHTAVRTVLGRLG